MSPRLIPSRLATRLPGRKGNLRHAVCRGFSLIELLVALAVVAILASIVISVTSESRMAPLQVKNVSQLRSIGAAVKLFAAEHDGNLPQYNYPGVNTHGTSAGYQSPARALFSEDRTVMGPKHPLGCGDYLDDVGVFYSPLLSKMQNWRSPDGGFYNDNGRRILGYYLYSLPSVVVNGRNPVVYNGQLISNTTINDWERSPLYSDYQGDAATQFGFTGKQFSVLHADGSVSSHDAQTIADLYRTSSARCYYYMATGRLN